MDVKAAAKKHFNGVPGDGPVRNATVNHTDLASSRVSTPATPGASSETPTVLAEYTVYASQH